MTSPREAQDSKRHAYQGEEDGRGSWLGTDGKKKQSVGYQALFGCVAAQCPVAGGCFPVSFAVSLERTPGKSSGPYRKLCFH